MGGGAALTVLPSLKSMSRAEGCGMWEASGHASGSCDGLLICRLAM